MKDGRKLTVGIFFNARREQGGLYQYSASLVDSLARYGGRHEYILFHAALQDLPLNPHGQNWQVVHLSRRAVQMRMGLEWAWLSLARGLGARLRGWLPEYPEIRRARVDLMLYVKPGVHPFLWPYPSIFPVHDLQHRLQPEFPEVSAGGEFKRREFFYRRSIPRASAILVDSEVGREDVVQLYGADAEKVLVLPYFAVTAGLVEPVSQADIERVRAKYRLPEGYYFYPAAFWPHKNHARILQALAELKQRGMMVPLALAGNPHHEYTRLVALAEELQIASQVHFLGYVPDEDLPALYQQARALLMPTFFGPTNIPVLEAWNWGCPVISSDIRGIREQVGEAGLLVDPRSLQSIAAGIYQLEQNPELRRQLAQRGSEKSKSWGAEDFALRLEEVIAWAARERKAV